MALICKELFQPAHTLIGAGCIKEVPRYIRQLGVHKAMVVTDAGLVKIGTVGRVTDVLDKAGIEYLLFDQVVPNPTTGIVQAACEAIVKAGCDCIIGIGGGSPLDVSKAAGILAVNGGRIEDYEGINKSGKPCLPLIAINTTAGTGSEVTRDYVITNEAEKKKMLMVDANCLASLALNDPELMAGMPPSLTAATGMDALCHAIEAYLSVNHFPFSDGLALEAIRRISKSLKAAVEDGENMEARTDMCWAQYMAGLAFSNAGLGLVHAMAHQLGGYYNTPHGVANAILLPYVMEFNAPVAKERLYDIAVAMGIEMRGLTMDGGAASAIEFVKNLALEIDIPPLCSTGYSPKDLATLALNSLEDTCIGDNPRAPSLFEVQTIFMNAYESHQEPTVSNF